MNPPDASPPPYYEDPDAPYFEHLYAALRLSRPELTRSEARAIIRELDPDDELRISLPQSADVETDEGRVIVRNAGKADAPDIWAGGPVRFFRQQTGGEHWVYQVDTTRPEGDQVYVIHEGEWADTEYETLARFLNNTRVFSPGTVTEITAEEAAAAHPARSTDLPPSTPEEE